MEPRIDAQFAEKYGNQQEKETVDSQDIRTTATLLRLASDDLTSGDHAENLHKTIHTLTTLNASTNALPVALSARPTEIAIAETILSNMSSSQSIQQLIEDSKGGHLQKLFSKIFGEDVQKNIAEADRVREKVSGILRERTKQIGDWMDYLGVENADVRVNRTKNSLGIFALVQKSSKFIPSWHQFSRVRTGEGIDPTQDEKPYGERITMDPGAHFRDIRFTSETLEHLQQYSVSEQKALIVYKEIEDFFQDKSRRGDSAEMNVILWFRGEKFELSVTEEEIQFADAFIVRLSRVFEQITNKNSKSSSMLKSDTIPFELLSRNHHLAYQNFSEATQDPFLKEIYAGKHLAVILDDKELDDKGYTPGAQTDPRMITAGYLRKVISFGVENIQDQLTQTDHQQVTQVLHRFNHRFYHGDPAEQQLDRVLGTMNEIGIAPEAFQVNDGSDVDENGQTNLGKLSVKGFNHRYSVMMEKIESLDAQRAQISYDNLEIPKKAHAFTGRKGHKIHTIDKMYVRDDSLYLPPEWFATYTPTERMYHDWLERIGDLRTKYRGINRPQKGPMQISLSDILQLSLHTAYQIETSTGIAKQQMEGDSEWDTYFTVFPRELFPAFEELFTLTQEKLKVTAQEQLTPQLIESVWSSFILKNPDFVRTVGRKLQVGIGLLQREKLQAMRGEGTQSFFSTLFGRVSSLEKMISVVSKNESLAGKVVTEAISNPQALISIMGGMKQQEQTSRPNHVFKDLAFFSAEDAVYYRNDSEDQQNRAGSFGIVGANEENENKTVAISNRLLPNQCYETIVDAVQRHATIQGYPFVPELEKAIHAYAFQEDARALSQYYDPKGWEVYKSEAITMINEAVKARIEQGFQRTEISTFIFLKILEEYALLSNASVDNPLQLVSRDSDITSRREKKETNEQRSPGILKKLRLRGLWS